MKNLLLVGFSPLVISKLQHRTDINVYVIEEKKLFLANNFHKNEARNSKILKEIIFTTYMNDDSYEEEVEKLNKRCPLSGVFSVRDYAVRTAAKIAEKYGLLGINEGGAKILTNKVLLREFCLKHNVPHPRYSKIESIDELKEFYNGGDVILKPANRQASLGISKISSIHDIEQAWEYTVNAEETDKQIIKRNFVEEYIAEGYVGGYEVSMETFVQNGKIIFNNITGKITLEDTFVEKGHVVPAKLDKAIKEKLELENLNFVQKLDMKDGILHSEWKVDNEQPILIECAGRAPGDGIPLLIDKTYGINYFNKVCDVYLGIDTEINNNPIVVSSSHFFIGEPGIVTEINGLDFIKNNDRIIDYIPMAEKGTVIKGTKSSWDRLAFFMTYADTYEELEDYSRKVLETVEFKIEKLSDNQ